MSCLSSICCIPVVSELFQHQPIVRYAVEPILWSTAFGMPSEATMSAAGSISIMQALPASGGQTQQGRHAQPVTYCLHLLPRATNAASA